MDYIAVIIAGFAGYAFGAAWYSLLGGRWRDAVGLSAEDVRPSRNISAFVIALVANIVVAGIMRHIFVSAGVADPVAGLVGGFGLGAFVAGAYILTNYSFARASGALKAIDIGHAAGSAAVIGLALGLMQ